MLECFDQLTRRCARSEEEFIAVVEVCGFNDWVIRLLRDDRCHKVILIQPEESKRCKTDRRDASALSELLWVNRDRFLEGKPVRGLRQVDISSSSDQQNRKLTNLRKEADQAQAQLVNKIKHILRRHNLQWDLPTKTFPTVKAVAWLKEIALPEIDRLEMNFVLAERRGRRKDNPSPSVDGLHFEYSERTPTQRTVTVWQRSKVTPRMSNEFERISAAPRVFDVRMPGSRN